MKATRQSQILFFKPILKQALSLFWLQTTYMKLFPLLLLCPVISYSQQACDNYTDHTAIGISYILPRSVSGEVAYFTKLGLTAGVGLAYTVPVKTTAKNEANQVATESNKLDIFAYAGYRIFQVDYKVSAFVNAAALWAM